MNKRGGMRLKRQVEKSFLCAYFRIGILCAIMFCGCNNSKDEIVIYTSAEDYRIEYLSERLEEEFPEYDIAIEYMSTGNHAAKLMAEGGSTACDISYDLEYGYMAQLDEQGMFANLSETYDMSIYSEDTVVSDNYVIEYRNGGAIILNMDVLSARGLQEPASYADLLKEEYRGLIAMPNPKSSGTGYMFLRNLVNAWGEEEAFTYFDGLSKNILQFTSSGSGPVNALLQGEVAIGLGMTGQAVMQLNEGANFKILYFEEGSPFSLYGQAMIKGKEERACVKEVFDFLIETYAYENNEKFFPEKIYKDKDFVVQNYPKNIVYGDMSNDTIAEKERLLEKWNY